MIIEKDVETLKLGMNIVVIWLSLLTLMVVVLTTYNRITTNLNDRRIEKLEKVNPAPSITYEGRVYYLGKDLEEEGCNGGSKVEDPSP